MREFCFAAAFAVVTLTSTSAFALQPLPDYLYTTVKSQPGYEQFATQVGLLGSQCNICHIPKADKKAKGHGLNDFGQAFHKHLDDGAFKKAHQAKPEDADRSDEAMKIFVAAWEKVQTEKNADGKTFGELMKAGKMPGEPPIK